MQVLGMNPTPREIKMLIEHYDFDGMLCLAYLDVFTVGYIICILLQFYEGQSINSDSGSISQKHY